ncbi:hypothetical protein ABT095_34565 [Kitasatospora sp. NPDC002227]|uniref:hypothetical protein n=1 Tax=Kitasatospora sp. NPDC002227 TaxID=3154773 RepID=UPI0033261E85
MELADRYRIPHSQLMGAGSGRWSALDRAKAMAFAAYRRQLCESCGTRAQEWEQDRFAYVAETHRCPGCELVEMEQDQVPRGPDGRGVKIGLRPRAE